MKRDLATTFLTEGVVVLCYLLSFRLVADHLGSLGFGEYALARRTLAVLMPLGALSTDIAVARYVAYAMTSDSERARRYAPAAGGLVLGAGAVIAAVLLLFPGPLAGLLFGSSRYSDLILPLPLLIFGGALHGIAYGSLRGRGRIQVANVLLGLNHGVVPLVAIELARGSVAEILLFMGAGWTVCSLAFLAVMPLSFEGLRERMVELARYGVPRVPGDLLRLALFSIPGVVVAHIAGVTSAGDVAFGIAAVGMLGTALSPIGFVMLPVAARKMATGDVADLRRQVVNIAAVTGAVLVAAIAVVELFAPQIIAVYLGKNFADTAQTLRFIIPAALPWGIYTSLASVIDAHHVRPVNARNMAITSGVFALITAALLVLHPTGGAVAVAFVLSLYVLGALTLFEVHTITTTTREEADALALPAEPVL